VLSSFLLKLRLKKTKTKKPMHYACTRMCVMIISLYLLFTSVVLELTL
jgi:hypothetical protein